MSTPVVTQDQQVFARRLQSALRNFSFRKDIELECLWGRMPKKAVAPAWYEPLLNKVTVYPEVGIKRRDPATINPLKSKDRYENPAIFGLISHEAAHTQFTPTYDEAILFERKLMRRSETIFQIYRALEEPRIERRQIQVHGKSHQRYLRASASNVLMRGKSYQKSIKNFLTGPVLNEWVVASTMILLNGRVFAGSLKSYDLKQFDFYAETILGHEKYTAILSIIQQAVESGDDDYEKRSMLAQQFALTLGAPTSDREDLAIAIAVAATNGDCPEQQSVSSGPKQEGAKPESDATDASSSSTERQDGSATSNGAPGSAGDEQSGESGGQTAGGDSDTGKDSTGDSTSDNNSGDHSDDATTNNEPGSPDPQNSNDSNSQTDNGQLGETSKTAQYLEKNREQGKTNNDTLQDINNLLDKITQDVNTNQEGDRNLTQIKAESKEQRDQRAIERITVHNDMQEKLEELTLKLDDARLRRIFKIETRDVTAEDLIAARRLEKALQKAKFREPAIIKFRSELPPGRFIGSQAMLREAQRSMGMFPTATPFVSKKRMVTPQPPLLLGVMTDVSGSMRWAEAEASAFSWACARAVSRMRDASFASVLFAANQVYPLVVPGRILPHAVTTYSVFSGGGEVFNRAWQSLVGSLGMMYRPGVRVIVIVSDGEYVPSQKAYARRAIAEATRLGILVVWVCPGSAASEISKDAHILSVEKSSAEGFLSDATDVVVDMLVKYKPEN